VTKMELSLSTGLTKMRRMGNEARNVEIRRARLEEAHAAFCLVEEYFAMAGVVMREDPEKFIQEYFAEGQGLWLARMAEEPAGCVGLRRLPRPEELEPEDVKCAEIKRMYVRKSFAGEELPSDCWQRLRILRGRKDMRGSIWIRQVRW
jgi:hypothetical protein